MGIYCDNADAIALPVTVLHVISGLQTGGAEFTLLRLLQADPIMARDAAVLSLRDDGTVGPLLRECGVSVTSLRLQQWRQWPGAIGSVRRVMAAVRPNVIHGWMYHGNLAAELGRIVGSRTAVTLWNVRHSLHAADRERASTRVAMMMGARSSSRPLHIVYNSKVSAEQHAVIGFDASKAVVIPNGFDVARFRPDEQASAAWRTRLGIAATGLVVGMIGRYHPVKDHATFLRAVGLMLPVVPELHVVLAGRGVSSHNRELMALVQGTGAASRIHLLDEIADTPGLLAAVDVQCCSSVGEAFPNIIGEAMAVGVPCVCTRVGDAPDLLGGTGEIVEPGQAEALAAACLRLLSLSPEARRRRGRLARERIWSSYSLKVMVERYQGLYAEASSGVAA